jgi:hypothetical protein
MDEIYNVTFVCDYVIVSTSIAVENELTDERIARIAGEYVEGNYGFNPMEMCHEYEVVGV